MTPSIAVCKRVISGRQIEVVGGTCYDPAVDIDGRIGQAIASIVELLAH